MADAAGTAISTFNLFDTLVRWFRCLRLAKSSAEELGRYQIRFDTICWRLDQWAQQHLTEHRQIPSGARIRLEAITDAFEAASKMSEAYETLNPGLAQGALDLKDFKTLSESARVTHESIQARIKGGPKSASIADDALWALYRGEEVKNIIDTAQQNIDQLYEMFPPLQKRSIEDLRDDIAADDNGVDLDLLKSFNAVGDDSRNAPRYDIKIWQTDGQGNRYGDTNEYGSMLRNKALNIWHFGDQGSQIGDMNKGPKH